jgi:hypothetical protein
VNDGKEGWECRWCNKGLPSKHASHALGFARRRFQREIGRDIRVCTRPIRSVRKPRSVQFALQTCLTCVGILCKAAIPERDRKRYSGLYKANTERQEAKKRSSDSVEESVVRQQNSTVGNHLRKRGDVGAVRVQQSSLLHSPQLRVIFHLQRGRAQLARRTPQ